MQTLLPILRTFLETTPSLYMDSYRMNKPWEHSGATYYTDGHICLRVPCVGIDDQAVSGDFEDFRSTVDSQVFHIFTTPFNGDWLGVPESELKTVVCRSCQGSGFSSECPECGGAGAVEFDSDFNNYICECLSCKGSGVTAGGSIQCCACSGQGRGVKSSGVPFGNDPSLGINAVLLHKLATLPGVRINSDCKGGSFAIRFDLPIGGHGEGVVMGYRL